MELYKDKLLHFVAGLVVGSLVLIAARYFAPPPIHAYWAFLGALLAGVLFEAYSHYEYMAHVSSGTADTARASLWDAAMTAAGGLVVALLYYLHNH